MGFSPEVRPNNIHFFQSEDYTLVEDWESNDPVVEFEPYGTLNTSGFLGFYSEPSDFYVISGSVTLFNRIDI